MFRWLWGAARAPWVAKSTDFTLLYFTLHNLVIFVNLTNFIASKKHRNPRGCLASPKQSDHKLTRQSHLPLVVIPALLALRDPGGLQPSCYGPTHVPRVAHCSHFSVRILPPISFFFPLTGISARGLQGRSDTALRLDSHFWPHMQLGFPPSSLFRKGRPRTNCLLCAPPSLIQRQIPIIP